MAGRLPWICLRTNMPAECRHFKQTFQLLSEVWVSPFQSLVYWIFLLRVLKILGMLFSCFSPLWGPRDLIFSNFSHLGGKKTDHFLHQSLRCVGGLFCQLLWNTVLEMTLPKDLLPSFVYITSYEISNWSDDCFLNKHLKTQLTQVQNIHPF